ncbi:Ubiquitin-conjugating enzyme E2 J1 [Tupaia chinensis]|uniref:Ubiquitin-conjugating enzyme E2 J1 n=1 Tax=Tupaia chinensis TaxID=246437 RepID=L9K8K4_TUPCH|nr:Ubiquitin-conjugating enzyme E2 J1 [Tupaia chinensis]
MNFISAVKRLMKEAAELKDPTDHYHAQPLEDNLFEWHFTVRGPPDSDFDGGVYHGRIVLPPEYPMKPPSIILLTAEVNSSGKTVTEADLNHSFSLNDLQGDIPATFQGATASTSYGAQNPSAPSFQQPTQPVAKSTSMSPRQRRAQQQSQRRSSTSPDVIQGPQPRDNHTDHGGSAVLIVILTLALAALIFRRIYLANEYIFDFEL